MKRYFLVLCWLLIAPTLKGQIPFTREFWLNEPNIPVKVFDLYTTPAGYQFLATENGLYRFNGRFFTEILSDIQSPVSAVTGRGQEVWAGFTDGRIAVLQNGKLVPLKIKNKRPHSSIHAISVTKTGLLFITTEEEGLFVVMGNTGIQISTAQGLSDNFAYQSFIFPDKVLVATDRGINEIKWEQQKISVHTFTTTNGLPDNIVRVIKRIPGSDQLIIGTQEGGMVLMNKDMQIAPLKTKNNTWLWGQVNDILPVSESEMIVATDAGYLLEIKLLKDSLTVHPYFHEGVKFNRLSIDAAGNIWSATNQGLIASTLLVANYKAIRENYQLPKITAIESDSNGNTWYASNDALFLVHPTDSSAPQFMIRTPASVTCLLAGKEGGLWIGTLGKGLFYLDKSKKLIAAQNVPALTNGHILSIASFDDQLWVSSLNGVEEMTLQYPFDGRLQSKQHHSKASGTGSDYIYQLFADSKKRMWMATDGNGICMFDGDQYHHWDSSSGLTSKVVYSITEDNKGTIWAGSLDKGLFSYDGKTWENINDRQGLADRNITSLKAMKNGQLVLVSQKGVDQWFPASKKFRHFNNRNGMHIDSASEVLNCITADPEGNVFLPFEHGLVQLRNQAFSRHIDPDVYIQSVNLFYKPIPFTKHLFAPDENNISFRFDGINFTNPEHLFFRYKLEGLSENWMYTADETVPFAQLRPGDYKFRVQASLNAFFDNSNEDSFSFRIAKPLWREWWFVASATIILCLLIYLFIRMREKGLRQMVQLQNERMLQEYEHLKSQVNPHFLFNSLNTLASLIEENTILATAYTERLSDLYRNMLSFKDQDTILLKEECEIIENYVYIQKSRFGEALQINMEIDESLMRTKRVVPLALQLLVENAIKHNIVSKSRPLIIRIAANETEISIRNNVQPKQSKEKGAGLGLNNIRKRYELLSGKNISYGIENNFYVVKLPLL